MKLSRLAILLGIIFWPLSLFVNNTFPDFVKYVFPFFQPKLLLFPLIFFALSKKKKLFFASLILFVIFFNRFWGQTVFKPDHESQQTVIRESQLYPNVFLARMFQNKARIYLDKLSDNFFALTDPNNYFFRFAPRQITVNNQNLKKFPSLAILPMLFGFYYLDKYRHKKLVLSLLVAGVLSLVALTAYDRHDIILWIPLCLVFAHGVNQINKRFPVISFCFWLIFVVFSLFELVQILL